MRHGKGNTALAFCFDSGVVQRRDCHCSIHSLAQPPPNNNVHSYVLPGTSLGLFVR